MNGSKNSGRRVRSDGRSIVFGVPNFEALTLVGLATATTSRGNSSCYGVGKTVRRENAETVRRDLSGVAVRLFSRKMAIKIRDDVI